MKSEQIRNGIKDGFPVFLGYFFVATAFGLICRNLQLTILQGQTFSFFVFAGASQFAAVSMLKDQVPAAIIVLTVFVMNLRHLMMSASLSRRIEPTRFGFRMALAFGVTDETFALLNSCKNREIGAVYMLSLNMTAWTGWNLGTVTGYLAGSFIPQKLTAVMGLGLYALFVALLVPQIKRKLSGLWIALTAGLLNAAVRFTMPGIKNYSLMISVIAVCLLYAIFAARGESSE